MLQLTTHLLLLKHREYRWFFILKKIYFCAYNFNHPGIVENVYFKLRPGCKTIVTTLFYITSENSFAPSPGKKNLMLLLK